MPEYGRIARVAVPVVAGAVGLAAAGAALKTYGDTEPPAGDPSPDPAPAPTPPHGAQASQSARLLASTSAAATQPDATAPADRRSYQNPVFAQNSPDPTVMRAADGMFYTYTTETQGLPFQVLRSPDLVGWERVGAAFAGTGPDWIDKHRWAPDVQRTGDHYTMTYSGRGGDGRMRIGYATSDTPAGPFQDRGILLEGDSYGYIIDPHLRKTDSGWVLYYGSTGGTNWRDQTGITAVAVKIGADGAIRTKGQGEVVLPEMGDRELVEGAWLHERDGEYFLFYSDGRWDARGGADDYQLKVAKGPSPTGPFEKLDRPVLAQGSGFTSTGHGSIVTDDGGQDWLLYHAWSRDPEAGRMLMLDPIKWQDGWPVIGNGRPSSARMDGPVIDARRGAER